MQSKYSNHSYAVSLRTQLPKLWDVVSYGIARLNVKKVDTNCKRSPNGQQPKPIQTQIQNEDEVLWQYSPTSHHGTSLQPRSE